MSLSSTSCCQLLSRLESGTALLKDGHVLLAKAFGAVGVFESFQLISSVLGMKESVSCITFFDKEGIHIPKDPVDSSVVDVMPDRKRRENAMPRGANETMRADLGLPRTIIGEKRVL